MYFIEHSYAGDPTNWRIPNQACVEALLRSTGFIILDQPEEEVFLCKRSAKGVPATRGALSVHVFKRQRRTRVWPGNLMSQGAHEISRLETK